jgi:hypothetical protein
MPALKLPERRSQPLDSIVFASPLTSPEGTWARWPIRGNQHHPNRKLDAAARQAQLWDDLPTICCH